jgi:AmmeMemoRadiSam system protein B
MVRKPAVAGQFYPIDKNTLLGDLGTLVPVGKDKIDAIGAVAPHAGYMYSGAVAGELYARLEPKAVYVVLSPNHHGHGADFAASSEPWDTPLGTIDVDERILSSVLKRTSLVKVDKLAHAFEHSAEVQVPFIQVTSPGAKIVPITVKYGSPEELEEVSNSIADAVKESGRDAIIIASSDMTHYESRALATKNDNDAIERILALDPLGLMRVVEQKNISMCGYVPAVMMLMASKRLGAKKAELIRYADSGDVTGDTDAVVGYASIVVYK